MGREIKRVPIDFKWPIGKIWKGYIPQDESEKYEPPEGEGYQLWETVTEGSPMSPVFETPEKLATWLVDNRISTCGTTGQVDFETWLIFITQHGWAPTLIFSQSRGLESGVKGIRGCS